MGRAQQKFPVVDHLAGRDQELELLADGDRAVAHAVGRLKLGHVIGDLAADQRLASTGLQVHPAQRDFQLQVRRRDFRIGQVNGRGPPLDVRSDQFHWISPLMHPFTGSGNCCGTFAVFQYA